MGSDSAFAFARASTLTLWLRAIEKRVSPGFTTYVFPAAEVGTGARAGVAVALAGVAVTVGRGSGVAVALLAAVSSPWSSPLPDAERAVVVGREVSEGVA